LASFHDSFAAMVGLIQDPAFFDNQIATLELEDRSATITFEKAVLDASKVPVLEKLYQYRLAQRASGSYR
jgi:hypothetical protein